MEGGNDKGLGLEIDGGRIHFRLRGARLPRNMPYTDCSGVSVSLVPSIGAFGMTLRYRVELLSKSGENAVQIGDTPSLKEARTLWRYAADTLEKPAMIQTPDGRDADKPPADPPPAGISRRQENGRTRLVVRRSRAEHAFTAVLALGLAIALIFGEAKQDDIIFVFVAAGLFVYAVAAGLSSRFLEIAEGRMTAGLTTPLGEFMKAEVPLRDIDAVMWGVSPRGWGKWRAAFAMAAPQGAKGFDRLSEDQAKWLTRYVRKAVRGSR